MFLLSTSFYFKRYFFLLLPLFSSTTLAVMFVATFPLSTTLPAWNVNRTYTSSPVRYSVGFMRSCTYFIKDDRLVVVGERPFLRFNLCHTVFTSLIGSVRVCNNRLAQGFQMIFCVELLLYSFRLRTVDWRGERKITQKVVAGRREGKLSHVWRALQREG